MSWLKKIFSQERKNIFSKNFKKTKNLFLFNIKKIIGEKSKINEEIFNKLEEVLISYDIGTHTTLKIIKIIKEKSIKNKFIDYKDFKFILLKELDKFLIESNEEIKESINPWIILIVGVNGVGKTTTIAKLAYRFKKNNKKVIIGAADTFRASAIEQVSYWANKYNIDIVKQHYGADPSSVAFDTIQSAISKKIDIVLIDTAGRLHNKINLMEELSKIERTIKKIIPEAPHDVLLVLDGTTGQNTFEQTRLFRDKIKIDNIIITKLDGISKGGILIGLSDKFKIPIKYIGLGEKIKDLYLFKKDIFLDSLLRDF